METEHRLYDLVNSYPSDERISVLLREIETDKPYSFNDFLKTLDLCFENDEDLIATINSIRHKL